MRRDAGPIRLLSYNIWEGGTGRLEAIGAVIRREAPDAVALLEANDRAQIEALADTLGMHLVFAEGNSPYHVAWLTRLPVIHAQNHRRTVFAKTLLEIVIGWSGTPLHLFATHLTTPDEEHREAEVETILEIMRPGVGGYQVLAGDFNAIAPGDDIGALHPPGERAARLPGRARLAIPALLRAGYVDCYRRLHQDAGYTYTAQTPWLRIDYLFASPRMAACLETCRVVAAPDASDHLPVAATFRSDHADLEPE